MVERALFRRYARGVAAALALAACASAALVGPAASPATAQSRPAPKASPKPAPRPDPSAERLARTSADALKAARDYRTSLERLLAVYEADLSRATELADDRQALFAKGEATQAEVEEAHLARLNAHDNVNEARQWIDEADRLLVEANLSDLISKLPPLAAGSFQSTEAFVRYGGTVGFTLAGVPAIQRFFTERFGRALPISAMGQTPTHDRFGFDHRQAIDVAVYPDSVEGRALTEYLRSIGVSFVAFRQAVAGAATGAHIHIGEPSRRVLAPAQR
jgi:hypothetical protein